MAYLTDENKIYELYEEASKQAESWREDYHEYERIADNEAADDLDESLPETTDGSLSAALFKLPKRIVNSDLKGRVKADVDEAWVGELANIVWINKIIPNANSMAPFWRKWKDAVRKAAVYGSVPIISLFVERGSYTGSDFIVGQPQDVKLEPGKVSDYDSDIMFWDVYYSELQLETMIERAKTETKEDKENDTQGHNKWYVSKLEEILASGQKEDRPANEDYDEKNEKDTERGGYHFCVVVQRGVDAPFYMYHKATKSTVREWSNQDPTGNLPIRFLYCYQDFKNPYGIGIVKLAGGTQNVLDHMRQSDVLATQIGLRPPKLITGNIDEVELDSLVYAQDANWIVGANAKVERQELSNQVYGQLPQRIGMYKTSLNQLIPTGDTSISADSGDPQYSKTPAGVKFQAQNLSIDDEDFKDNLYMTFEAVAESMINIHFANMQGSDLMKLTDDEKDVLAKAGLEFPEGEDVSNELEVIWENARANFTFEIDAEEDEDTERKEKLEGLVSVAELLATDPTVEMSILESGKKVNKGELFSTIIALSTDNDKIITDIAPEDQNQLGQGLPEQLPGQIPGAPQPPLEQVDPVQQEVMANMNAVMSEHGVDEGTAAAMLEAERQGFSPEQVLGYVKGEQNV